MSEEAKARAVVRALHVHDPHIDILVRKLCEEHGYGAVMDSAARQWALKDSYGALYIEGCLAMESLK